MFWKDRPRRPVEPGASGFAGTYSSQGLAKALDMADRCAAGAALDLGPVHDCTLEQLSALDLQVNVAALEPDADGKLSMPSFDDGAFALILGWDYPARVAPERRAELAAELVRWLAPAGVILLILPTPSRGLARAHQFRVHSASEIESTAAGPIAAGWVPTTREVLVLFSELECNGARILRRGGREFVLRKRANA